MADIIEVYKAPEEAMSESQHQELEMLRKLNVLRTFRIEGRSDQECEDKWMSLFDGEPASALIYVSEPGKDRELKNS